MNFQSTAELVTLNGSSRGTNVTMGIPQGHELPISGAISAETQIGSGNGDEGSGWITAEGS